MGYEKSVEKSRLKDRSEELRGGSIKSWTVAASFSGNGETKVTMILTNTHTGNTFYEKHVLRHSEDPAELFNVRNAERDLRDAITSGDSGAANLAASRMETGSAWDVKTTGAPASTVIVLNKINHEMMLFRFAKALFEHRKKFVNLNQNYEVEVEMGCKCVYNYSRAKRNGYYDGIIVGAQLKADDGAGKMTFDVNHCVGSA